MKATAHLAHRARRPGRKTKEEARVTRERLLDASERLFALHGVSAVTVGMIATEAEMTSGAFYWHFDDKAVLLEALFDRAYGSIAETVRDFGLQCSLPEHLRRIERFCLDLLLHATIQSDKFRLFIILLTHSEMTTNSVLRKKFVRAESTLRDALRANIKSAVEHGGLGETLDPDLAAMFVHAQLTGVARLSLMDGSPSRQRQTAAMAMSAAIFALESSRTAKRLSNPFALTEATIYPGNDEA